MVCDPPSHVILLLLHGNLLSIVVQLEAPQDVEFLMLQSIQPRSSEHHWQRPPVLVHVLLGQVHRHIHDGPFLGILLGVFLRLGVYGHFNGLES